MSNIGNDRNIWLYPAGYHFRPAQTDFFLNGVHYIKSIRKFLFVFMNLDEALMSSIRQNEPMGRFMNPYIASCVVALEGVFSGLLVTFILINFVETDEVNQPQG